MFSCFVFKEFANSPPEDKDESMDVRAAGKAGPELAGEQTLPVGVTRAWALCCSTAEPQGVAVYSNSSLL